MIPSVAIALSVALPWPVHAPATGQEDVVEEVAEEVADEVQRLTEWPSVASKDATKTEIQKLRKARTEAMGDAAREALIAEGAGIVPLLLRPFAREKGEEVVARIQEVLDAVVGKQHTRLLAAEFKNKSVRVRTWALACVARHPDAGVRVEAEAAWAKVLDAKKKADPMERLNAALCLTSSGSTLALEELCETAVKGWGEHGPALRSALEAVRGKEATQAVLHWLEDPKRRRKIAGLNVLAGCGDPDSARIVARLLDQSDASIRLAAINALRGIVDGDQPIDKLPVFEAIERANKWKARI